MNKTQLIEAVAGKTDQSKADAGRSLNAVLEAISEALGEGDSVALPGFGTFEVKHRGARTVRSPRDPSQLIEVPARNLPAFKPGKILKEKVA